MSDPFSAAGFALTSQSDWDQLALMAAGQGETVPGHRGDYRRWRLDCGVELWAHVRSGGQVVGLSPHFNAQSRFKARVVRLLPRQAPFDIAVGAWAVESDEDQGLKVGDTDTDTGLYPFVFDAPDGATYRDVVLPQLVDLQLVGFAFDVRTYPTEAAFATAQHEDETPLAARAFIPTSALNVSAGAPPASAVLAGVIQHTETLENQVGQSRFEWARVETYGGLVDVLAHPETIQGDLVTGGVLQGSFWMSGRILNADRKKPGLLSRLRR